MNVWIKQVSVNASQCSKNPSLAFSFSHLTATFFVFITWRLLCSCFTLLILLVSLLLHCFHSLSSSLCTLLPSNLILCFTMLSFALFWYCFQSLYSNSIKVSTRLLSFQCFVVFQASVHALSLRLMLP